MGDLDVSVMLQSNVVELIQGSEIAYGALLFILMSVVYIQRRVKLDDQWVFKWKHRFAYGLNPFSKNLLNRPLTRKKGKQDFDEYVVSVDQSIHEVKKAVTEYGYETNLASTSKYIIKKNRGRSWEVWSFRYRDPDSDKQYHLYLFDGHGNYGADLWQHVETDWTEDPEGHVSDGQTPGDPDNVLRPALMKAGLDWERDSDFRKQLV